MTFDAVAMTEDRFEKDFERTSKQSSLGATTGAMALVQRHIDTTTEIVAKKVQERRRAYTNLINIIEPLSAELIALVALQGSLTSIANCEDLSKTYLNLGKLLEDEFYRWSLQTWDKKNAARLEMLAKRTNSSWKHRKTAIRSMARKGGFFAFTRWKDKARATAGQWLVEVVLQLEDVFFLRQTNDEIEVDAPYLMITEEAQGYSQEFIRTLLDRHPVALPLLSPPPPWQGPMLTLDAHGTTYHHPLVRRNCKITERMLKEATEDGSLRPVLEAVSRIQDTGWRINRRILDILQWCLAEKIDVPGLPPTKDIPLPNKLTDEQRMGLTEDQAKARRRDVSQKVRKNRGYIGKREVFKGDLETALKICENGGEYWTPVNLDYRGRVYATTHFNFQRQDYVRALFQFSQGKALGPFGLYWLMIHVANCGDFQKVSKKSFEDRMAWVKDNHGMIIEIWADPKASQHLWKDADAPLQFLAACIEYGDALHSGNPSSFVSHLPVSFDGSCSGLQHFGAMTRCEVTAPLVNLTPQERPQDVYQTVADKVRGKVAVLAQGSGEAAEAARMAMAFGVDRSLVKRNVMTWAYSSKRFGMSKQLRSDTMVPLADEVLLGDRVSHPFAIEGERYAGQVASKMLAGATYEAIEETLIKPAEAMRFLQGIARTLAHEGKPTIWHTPMGLPVVMRYPTQEITRISLFLQDRGVTIKTRVNLADDAEGIDKNKSANTVAPSFVHSMDACHLMQVVQACAYRGIHSFALVHDSFGTHAADCNIFRETIQSEFAGLYRDHDVLQDIYDSACEQLETNHHRLPTLPDKGTYNINEVLDASYAFA